jgi:hypothetical protein
MAGAEPNVPSTFPAVRPLRANASGTARRFYGPPSILSNTPPPPSTLGVVNRADIVWLGISSGVMGCLVGGMMLGIGMDLIVNGQPLGWLLMLPGAPISAIPGWLLGRRLAQQL